MTWKYSGGSPNNACWQHPCGIITIIIIKCTILDLCWHTGRCLQQDVSRWNDELGTGRGLWWTAWRRVLLPKSFDVLIFFFPAWKLPSSFSLTRLPVALTFLHVWNVCLHVYSEAVVFKYLQTHQLFLVGNEGLSDDSLTCWSRVFTQKTRSNVTRPSEVFNTAVDWTASQWQETDCLRAWNDKWQSDEPKSWMNEPIFRWRGDSSQRQIRLQEHFNYSSRRLLTVWLSSQKLYVHYVVTIEHIIFNLFDLLLNFSGGWSNGHETLLINPIAPLYLQLAG